MRARRRLKSFAPRMQMVSCVWGMLRRRTSSCPTHLFLHRMPLIPEEELLASSRRHPLHPDMVWLLHARRVPALPCQGAAEAGVEQPGPVTRDPDQPVWM